MGRFNPDPTPHGHQFGEAASALQKSIRRGLEMDALYWAAQLDLAGYGKYVWRRLMVIASEDIGLADKEAVLRTYAHWQTWLEYGRNKGQEYNQRGAMAQAVMDLSRCPKSRICNDATAVWMQIESGDTEFRREVPDYALDMHTPQGRRMGRGIRHYFEEGAKLENERTIAGDDEYFELMKWWEEKEEGGSKDVEPQLPTEEGAA